MVAGPGEKYTPITGGEQPDSAVIILHCVCPGGHGAALPRSSGDMPSEVHRIVPDTNKPWTKNMN